jgi:hypothetical protein
VEGILNSSDEAGIPMDTQTTVDGEVEIATVPGGSIRVFVDLDSDNIVDTGEAFTYHDIPATLTDLQHLAETPKSTTTLTVDTIALPRGRTVTAYTGCGPDGGMSGSGGDELTVLAGPECAAVGGNIGVLVCSQDMLMPAVCEALVATSTTSSVTASAMPEQQALTFSWRATDAETASARLTHAGLPLGPAQTTTETGTGTFTASFPSSITAGGFLVEFSVSDPNRRSAIYVKGDPVARTSVPDLPPAFSFSQTTGDWDVPPIAGGTRPTFVSARLGVETHIFEGGVGALSGVEAVTAVWSRGPGGADRTYEGYIAVPHVDFVESEVFLSSVGVLMP